jgi:hypothetical protein
MAQIHKIFHSLIIFLFLFVFVTNSSKSFFKLVQICFYILIIHNISSSCQYVTFLLILFDSRSWISVRTLCNISVCKRIYVSWYIYLLCFDNWQKCICMWSEGLQCKKKKISRQFKFWVEFIYLKIWIDLQNCSSFIRMKKIYRRIERK